VWNVAAHDRVHPGCRAGPNLMRPPPAFRERPLRSGLRGVHDRVRGRVCCDFACLLVYLLLAGVQRFGKRFFLTAAMPSCVESWILIERFRRETSVRG